MTMLLEEVLPYLRKGRRARNGGCEYRVENRELQLMTVSGDWTSSMDPLLDGWVLVPEQFDFLEAGRRLESGKCVRMSTWNPGRYWRKCGLLIVDAGGGTAAVCVDHVSATNWSEVDP